jgi:hypothetical protein
VNGEDDEGCAQRRPHAEDGALAARRLGPML